MKQIDNCYTYNLGGGRAACKYYAAALHAVPARGEKNVAARCLKHNIPVVSVKKCGLAGKYIQ